MKNYFYCVGFIFRSITIYKWGDILIGKSEHSYYRSFNILPIPILIIDRFFKIIFLNEAFMKIYGYDLKEIINSDISILHTSREESIIDQRIINIIFGDKKKIRYITKHNTKHGTLIDVDIYVSSINLDNEDFVLYCIREFTEQQEVLRSYERGLDIMTKVVKELSM